MTNRFSHNIASAFQGITSNKFRALLTSLGMIFGVAAVISMMAIGKGTELQILEQLKEVGSNNIIIQSLEEDEMESTEEETTNAPKRFSPGLTLKDVSNIRQILPKALVSAVIESELNISANSIQVKGVIKGVNPQLFKMRNIETSSGKLFSNAHLSKASAVCIINQNLESRLFSGESAIGKNVKLGEEWLTVIGVISNHKAISGTDYFGSNSKYLAYAPVTTFLSRIGDPAKAEGTDFQENGFGSSMTITHASTPHQLKRIIVQLPVVEEMMGTAGFLENMLLRRHNQVVDYEVVVPQLLLKQQQKTKKIFSLVLGLIAGISLLVGGIGIMNIMLATVYERIREIGLRLSIGATKKDVITQFLAEAVLICVSGGVIGVLLGVILAQLVDQFLDIDAVITFWSVFLSFTISVAVGVIFGWYPANKAASQSPIESMRHD